MSLQTRPSPLRLLGGHFAAAARAALPEAALAPDRFPIRAHRNDAVAAVPREENRRLQKLGDERRERHAAAFGFDPDHLGEEAAARFAELKGSDLKRARAWALPGSVPTLLGLQR